MHGMQFYLIELRSTLASHSAGIPAMQVCYLVPYLPGTLCTPCVSFSTEPHAAGFTLTCGQGCNVARALMHIATQLPRPICPLLDHTPSIEEGNVNETDILSDVKLSLFRTQCHPHLILPWVEVCLHNTF